MATMIPSSGVRAAIAWRPLMLADLAHVAALERQIHAAPWTFANFRDALAAGHCATVAEREGRIVAFGVLMLAPGEAQVLNLSVVHDARRQGLGRTLLRRFVDIAVRAGAEQCFLEVRMSNAAALALYADEGFAPIGRRHDYYPATATMPREDALVLRRALGPPRPPYAERDPR
ncbi:MAG: ribosomal protein S18-alanine N-acetyltransferase [Betaproteobacteria bacterium]